MIPSSADGITPSEASSPRTLSIVRELSGALVLPMALATSASSIRIDAGACGVFR